MARDIGKQRNQRSRHRSFRRLLPLFLFLVLVRADLPLAIAEHLDGDERRQFHLLLRGLALLLLVTATWAASVDTSSDEFGSLQRRMFSFGVGDSCVALPFQTVAPRVFRCTSPERVAPL